MRTARILAVLLLVGRRRNRGYLARPHVDQWRAAQSPLATDVSAPGTYQCAMHPQIVSDHPGTCPICQMKLQRVDAPAAASARARRARHAALLSPPDAARRDLAAAGKGRDGNGLHAGFRG